MNHHQDMINSMKRKRELGEEIDSQIRKEIKQGNLRNILTEGILFFFVILVVVLHLN